MSTFPPIFNSISDFHQQLRAGKTTCIETVQYYIQQAKQNASLNAWVEIFEEEALQRAQKLDDKMRQSPESLGRLFGVVLSLKDNICFAGHRVTAASKILENFTATYSATAVERLLAQDAIILGRTNCDQFGMGSSNENSVFGAVRNAADPNRVPGGSSGGAAVSVQTDSCLAAIGSDTGGSVRQPAGFCGLWGMKPTYGRVSRHGLLAYGSSFDQIGCITRCADDAAVILEVISGADDFDSTASRRTVPPFSKKMAGQGRARVAYFPQIFDENAVDAGVRQSIAQFFEQLRQYGHTVEAVNFEGLEFVVPCYYVLTTAEASSNLARYDGIRYGFRHPDAQNLMETYLKSRSVGFSEEVKRRILLGTFVLSSGYYDAYYTKAQQVRRLLQDRLLAIFREFDFVALPVAPSVAWRFGEKNTDPVAMYLSDIFTVLANLTGVPAMALPIGRHPDNQMPVGLQLMSDLWQEQKLLTFGSVLKDFAPSP